MSIINIENFFDFGNHEAINRIAYTEEDAKYKLKCIKYMQDLGMKISIDDIGNICGTLKGNKSQGTLLIGSHTDSVSNGGQFDGPVGVYMALKSAEDFKNHHSGNQYGDLKTIIYAGEESTRFKTACLGSYYLSGKIPASKFETLKDANGVSLSEAIANYKGYIFSHLAEYGIDLNNIELKDKVVEQSEIKEAIEAHIEQAETLLNSDIAIGGVDSIVKPLRGTVTVSGKDAIVTSAQIVKDFNSLALQAPEENLSEIYRISVPEFNSANESSSTTVHSQNGNLLKISVNGESNHSGTTPMQDRKDAVLGLSNLILKLNELQKQNPNFHFNFLNASTPNWGPNQIQDNANLILQIEPSALFGLVKKEADNLQQSGQISFNIEEIDEAQIPTNPQIEMFSDIRQQYPATAEATNEKVFEMFKNIQDSRDYGASSVHFRITTNDTPVKTSPELLENIKLICYEKKIPCQIMHSWAGHDIACVLDSNVSNGKKVMFFIPSKGGSHNPNEITSKTAIETGTDVFSTLVSQRMQAFEKKYKKELDKVSR